MSRFYVGQRVRFVGQSGRKFNNPVTNTLVGKTGTIIARCYKPLMEWTVSLDSSEYDIDSAQCLLEPILPPGLETLAETLALWLPEGVSA